MIDTIKDYLSKEDFVGLREYLSKYSADDLESTFENMDDKLLIEVFDHLEKEQAAELFVTFSKERQEMILNKFSDVEISDVTEEILDDNMQDVLGAMDRGIVHQLLMKADPELRNDKIIEILDFFEEKKFSQLKPLLADLPAVDIADIMSEIDVEKLPILFRLLPKDLAAETFVEMDPDQQKVLLQSFSDKELKLILDELFLDDTVDLIEEMPANVVKRILAQSDSASRKAINDMLRYPEDSAGSIMTPECISLRTNMTVKECFDKIRRQAMDKETVYTCYVTDNQKKLLGIVTVKDLLLHDYEECVGTFMEDNFIYVDTLTDKEDVAQILSKYNLLAVPVVDQENLLVGIVTVDDAIDVITDEASEDIAKMAAITPSDKPYLQTSVWSIWLNRVPWLLLLMISATFTGIILNTYEVTLNSISFLLFACVPMLMDTAGNAGSQASVTVIRGLALDEVDFKDIFKVIWKELRVSILLGLTLAIVCFLKLQLVDNLLLGYDYTAILSAVVSLSLMITIVLAKCIGCTLPLIAKKCHLDPAVVASPFITTIVDALSLLIYCNIALAILA